MLGFNWVDLVVVVVLVAAVAEGLRIGVLSQLFVIAGFFAALFVSGWLFPHLVRFHDPTLRTLVNATLVLLTSLYAAVRCLDAGQSIHWSFRLGRLAGNHKFETAETVLGSLPSLAAGVVLVWLLGVMVGRLPFVGLSNSVNDARIIQGLTRTLPPVPAVFAEFDSQINPNAQPLVAAQPKPQARLNYSSSDMLQAVAKAAPSVVRITSFSCGGILGGSGFVVAPGLVATNAHVIAGSHRPVIKYNDASFEGVPVYFDAVRDLAILRVSGLHAPALTVAPDDIAANTTVAVLGYPGGDYRAEPGIVRAALTTTGSNIYSQGNFAKAVYQIQTSTDYGSSGGPAVAQNGQVVGMMFSKSNTAADVAYAVTAMDIHDALRHAKTSYERVGTGACTAD